jgi:uncharacterized membrane protein
MSKLMWILSRIRRTLWIRVALYALAGVAAALLASASSQVFPGKAPFDISSDAIDSLLTIVASSMLAVTTFSVGALTAAYAGATSHATPRATPLLTEDQVVQHALSTFVGSFLFSIVGLIALKVSAYGPEGRVVLFAVTLVVIFLIVLALLRWIDRLTQLGRVADTISRIEDATKKAMQAQADLPFLGGNALLAPREGFPILAACVGYVQFIDTSALCEQSDEMDIDIDVHVLSGTFVYQNTVLASVPFSSKLLPDHAIDRIRKAFTIGSIRTYDQDPRFGLVVLSEVALRALSPAVNDPGTAIDVIGRQTRLLSYCGEAWTQAAQTEAKYPRIRVPALQQDDLFEDAFNLIGRDGGGQVDVLLRLVKALQALADTGPDSSRVAARRQLNVALERAERLLQNPDDRRRLQAVANSTA